MHKRAPSSGCGNLFKGKMTQAAPGGPKTRVQGVLSPAGAVAFQAARNRLRGLYREVFGVQPARVSDGDTIEFLARGEIETRRYLHTLAHAS